MIERKIGFETGLRVCRDSILIPLSLGRNVKSRQVGKTATCGHMRANTASERKAAPQLGATVKRFLLLMIAGTF